MKQKDKKVWTPYVMVFPAFAVMMLVVVLPIINTILQSFQTVDGTFTMANYQYFFTSKEAFQSLIFTAIEAFSTIAFGDYFLVFYWHCIYVFLKVKLADSLEGFTCFQDLFREL